MNHATAQYFHAKRRARERLGMRYTPELAKHLVSLIQNRKLEFVERESGQRSKYRFWFNDQDWFVIYDKNTKSIVTFLPTNQESFYFVQFNA